VQKERNELDILEKENEAKSPELNGFDLIHPGSYHGKSHLKE